MTINPSWIPVLVPDGEYEARTVKAERRPSVGGKPKIFILFEIVVGEHSGQRLYLMCNDPKHGSGPGSKFFETWFRANGGPPGRGDRMPLRIFKDRLFMIRTRTVTTDNRKRPRHPAEYYSVVDEILPLIP